MIHKDCHITLPHQVCEECRLQTLALAQGRIPYQSDGRRGSAAVLAPQQSDRSLTHTYVHMYRAMWDTWGWSRWNLQTQNPQFDPSHPSVAPTGQRLDSGGVAVGGAPGTCGTRVQGHLRHLGMV